MNQIRSFKTEIDVNTATQFLESVMGGSVSDVSAINEGELSKVFSYVYQDKAFVIRFNRQIDNYEVDQIVYDSLSTYGVLIPRPVRTGRAGELYYSIVERAGGQSIASFPDDVVKRVLPHLVDQFSKITEVSVADRAGYGLLLPSGEGAYESWSHFLVSFFRDNQPGFWEGWYSLFEQSFIEREVFDRYYALMMEYAKSSPEERYFVHGDFHLGNMITDGIAVTGIVDWGMVMYGDFMFDVATMHFWRPDLDFPGLVREAWDRHGRSIPHFDERLKCGLICKGLDGLRFFARKGDRGGYDFVNHQMTELAK